MISLINSYGISSIFDDVLSLEVKTLSLICLGKLFQILTPENLSD